MSGTIPNAEPRPKGPRRILLFGVVTGAALRLATYVSARSYRMDESHLLLNIVNKDFSQLLEPLFFNQAAPYWFLAIENALYEAFGISELALRLPPVAASIAALVLFALLARQLLDEVGAVSALWCFAVGIPLVYWSAELKPYSFDVLATCVLLLCLVWIDERPSLTRVGVFALVAALAVWFSFPSVFVIAGAAAWLLWRLWSEEGTSAAAGLALCTAPLVSFLIYYRVTLREAARNDSLVRYWGDAFMPLVPTSVADLYWYPSAAMETVRATLDFTMKDVSLNSVLLLILIVGLVAMWRRRHRLGAALVLPPLFTLLASAFHAWPYSGRLLLFLAPLVAIVIGAGAGAIVDRLEMDRRHFYALGGALLLLVPLARSMNFAVLSPGREEIRPVLRHVGEERKASDNFYVYWGARAGYSVYSPSFDLPVPTGGRYGDWVGWDGRQERDGGQVVYGNYHRGDWEAYRRELDRSLSEGRWWIIYSHVYRAGNEKQLFDWMLARRGTAVDSIIRPGASAYLYRIGP